MKRRSGSRERVFHSLEEENDALHACLDAFKFEMVTYAARCQRKLAALSKVALPIKDLERLLERARVATEQLKFLIADADRDQRLREEKYEWLDQRIRELLNRTAELEMKAEP